MAEVNKSQFIRDVATKLGVVGKPPRERNAAIRESIGDKIEWGDNPSALINSALKSIDGAKPTKKTAQKATVAAKKTKGNGSSQPEGNGTLPVGGGINLADMKEAFQLAVHLGETAAKQKLRGQLAFLEAMGDTAGNG